MLPIVKTDKMNTNEFRENLKIVGFAFFFTKNGIYGKSVLPTSDSFFLRWVTYFD